MDTVRRVSECLADSVIRLDPEGNSDKGRSVFSSRHKRDELSRSRKTANKFLKMLECLQILGIH